jgi:hypothetical protein
MDFKQLMEAAIVIIFILAVGAAAQIFLGPDNVIEETAEQIIENRTGMDIDLSPSTPEKDKEKKCEHEN